MIISGLFFLTGIYLLSTLSADTARSIVTIYMVITGIGVGFSFPLLSMSSIHGLDMRQRGTANSTNTFFRSIGMTLGVTIYGTIQNHLLMDKLEKAMPMMKQFNPSGDTRVLLSQEARAHIPPEVLQKIVDALADSIATMFAWAIIPVIIAIILILFMGPARLTDQFSETKKAQS